jgi:hypothetical protein
MKEPIVEGGCTASMPTVWPLDLSNLTRWYVGLAAAGILSIGLIRLGRTFPVILDVNG